MASSLTMLDGNLVRQAFSISTDSAGSFYQRFDLDSGKAIYRWSANFTPTATGAVTVVSIVGNATRPMRIRRILLSGVSTALSASAFQLQRTSALGAGGTAVNPTVAKLDLNSPTPSNPTAVAHYTSTLKAAGTAVGGPLATWIQFTDTVTTPTVTSRPPQVVFPEGRPDGQSLVLRGSADFLEIQNVTPANLGAGTVLAYMIEAEDDYS